MYKIRILNAGILEDILSMDDYIEAVEKAYSMFVKGEAGLFPIIAHEFEPEIREMDIKSGHMEGAGVFGLKVVGYAASNPSTDGTPALSGLVTVLSSETGRPKGLVDGMTITNHRTGAAGAIGAKYLARPGSGDVLVVGSGAQARAQTKALLHVMPGVRRVTAASRNRAGAELYISEMSPLYPEVNFSAIDMEHLEKPAGAADIIVTCTPSHKPFLKREWVAPGTHINAIGADFPGKQEIDESLLPRARVFADSRQQVVRQGECRKACELGILEPDSIVEIGNVILGAPGRVSDADITVFDSTGMALQDIISASVALEKAESTGVGQLVDM
ncbi:MAG: ornithine cyclodeaminase family protein [Synergistota bacterium]|nr:ornithine cyclodeaminase family protein [Synergistota bacterium]